MDAKELLISLSNAVGVSGYETERAEIILAFLKEHCDEAKIDKFGNVIGLKRGVLATQSSAGAATPKAGKLMFSSHMDEIGLMVAGIDEFGFLGVTQIGGFDQRNLLAQEVIVHGKEKISGVIGLKPPHITTSSDAKKAVKLEHLLVDTGFDADEVKALVSIGDIITIDRKVVELKNNRLSGKAMDDNAGIAAYAVLFEKLKSYRHDLDLYFVASAQEEVGARGAQVAAQEIMPDMAIALEVGFGKSAEGANDGDLMLGDGVELVCGPNINRKMFERLRDLAKKNGIKYNVTVTPGMTGTDARSIQITGAGVATALATVPVKYMHTSVETICMDDVEELGRLLGEFIISFNGCDVEEFLCF